MSVLNFQADFRYRAGFQLQCDFVVEAGITALVGPSGSGKSTTLHLIAGLLRPDRGRIELGKRVLFDRERKLCLPPEQRAVGYVFQDYQLFPHLSVEQNLRYGQRRRPARQIDFAHLVDVLELGSLLQRWPSELSGGQKQRTALGRAILRGPELLLLDEPLSALDAELRNSVAAFLQRVIREYAIPTILVSHDSLAVEQLADRIVRLEAGHVV